MSADTNAPVKKSDVLEAIHRLETNFGKPFTDATLEERVVELHSHVRQFTPGALAWAIGAANRTLERFPNAAQIRRLCQASPDYQAVLDRHRRTTVAPAPPPDRCPECNAPRAYHRVEVLGRPLASRLIRHDAACSYLGDLAGLTFLDPFTADLAVGEDAWRRLGVDWDPPKERKKDVREEATAP